MQRVRRLVPLALVAVLGVAGLTGCRSNPAVAVYLGDRQITIKHIDAMLDEVLETVPAGQMRDAIDHGEGRQIMIQLLIVADLATRVAKAQGLPLTEPSDEIIAQVMQVQPGAPVVGTEFGRTWAMRDIAVAAISQHVEAATPTEADQREVYANASSGGEPLAQSFEAMQPTLTRDLIGKYLGLRNTLAAAVHQYHVVVNPRYAPLNFGVTVNLLQVTSYVQVSLADR